MEKDYFEMINKMENEFKLPEKSGGGVWPASQIPYPIYDQNLRFSLPYL